MRGGKVNPGAAPSSPASPSEGKVDASAMSVATLQTHVDRCRRLVERPQLLDRLPDGGESIRNRLEVFEAEIARRKETTTNSPNGCGVKSAGQLSQCAPPPCTDGASATRSLLDNETQKAREETGTLEAETYATNVAVIMEKYKDREIPVEETVRRMYGSTLSEREIQRILADVPPGYFLSYTETCRREKAMAQQARREELEKLRQQTAAAHPQ